MTPAREAARILGEAAGLALAAVACVALIPLACLWAWRGREQG